MIYVTYKDMTARYGDHGARKILRTLESLGRIQNAIVVPLDQETRFRRALDALNAINFAA